MKTFSELKAGNTAVGSFILSQDSGVVSIADSAGLDFVVLDDEHGLFDETTVESYIKAVNGMEIDLFIRLTMSRLDKLGAYFDSNINGVIVAGCSSIEDVQSVINSVKFHPEGKRGLNPFVRNGSFGLMDVTEFTYNSNRESSIWIMAENEKLISQLDTICELTSLSGIFLGPYDLSMDMGMPGKTNSEEVINTLQRAVNIALSNELPVGIFVDDVEQANYWIKKGVQFVIVGVDYATLAKSWQAIAKSFG